MKKKQKVDIMIGLTYILAGTLFLLFPLYHINNIKWLNIIFFSVIGIVSLIQFILNIKSKDYTGLYSFIASIVFIICMFAMKVSKPRYLSMAILIWVMLMSMIKMKKSDYYHDRRDRMWKLNLLMLGIFILSGTLTSINLFYDSDVQEIVIGFFLFICGILEIMDPVVKYLTSR